MHTHNGGKYWFESLSFKGKYAPEEVCLQQPSNNPTIILWPGQNVDTLKTWSALTSSESFQKAFKSLSPVLNNLVVRFSAMFENGILLLDIAT